MTGPHLIYFADPMCSWCWGFSPVVDAIGSRFGEALPVRLMMGGLRPGTTEPMDEAAKARTREHWEHVAEASGQPFDFSFFDRAGFVYDTEPASRAVVLMRRYGMAEALAYLRRVHAAFYAENRDVTDETELADLAASSGVDRGAFLDALRSEEARHETWTDFAIAQKSGITGFPTLIAGEGDTPEYALVTQGYQPGERIVPTLERWLEGIRMRSAHDAPAA